MFLQCDLELFEKYWNIKFLSIMDQLYYQSNFNLLCTSKNPVYFFCNDPQCKTNPVMCSSTQCQCQIQKHIECNIIKSKSLIEKMVAKRQNLLLSVQVKKIISTISQIYGEMIEKISDQREQLILKFQYFGLQQNSTKMFKLGIQGRCQQMTSQLINKVAQQLKVQTKICALEFDQFSIISQWEKQKERFIQYLDDIREFFQDQFLTGRKRSIVRMDSKIIEQKKQVQIINEFIGKSVRNYRLLYRASENQFSSSIFHTKCDNIANTLILINTESDKIIGGFTPLTWEGKSFKNDDQQSDNYSFLFSITLKQKYPALKREKAIYCSPAYGPLFGTNDIYLRDQCHLKKGCFNFPAHYSDGKVQNSQFTKLQFCGAVKGDQIGVKQYQVFEVIFD